MRRVAFCIFLLLLVACSTEHRNPALCEQQLAADSSLNIILGFHNLHEGVPEEYVNRSVSYLRSVVPFDRSTYNIYTFEIPDASCWPKGDKTVVKSQLDCDWNQVNARIEACALQNAKVVIITGEDVQTVTAPTRYETSLSIINEREFTRYGFLHEFGHLFGLQEETTTLRVKRTSPAYLPRKPNCAENTTTAREWWGEYQGIEGTDFYNGCAGHANYIKPNKDTIMSDKALEGAGYGYVSTKYLQEAYDCCYAANRTAYSCDAFFTKYPEWSVCR